MEGEELGEALRESPSLADDELDSELVGEMETLGDSLVV